MSEMVKGLGGVSACTPEAFGNFLVGDHSGNRGVDCDDSRRTAQVGAQQAKVLGRRIQVDDGVVLGILGDFEGAGGNGAVGIQELGAIQLYASPVVR